MHDAVDIAGGPARDGSRTIFALLLLFLPVLAVVCWNPRGNFWAGVEPPKAQVEAYDAERLASAKTLDASIYDAAKLDRLVREPQNTLSNFAYVAVGLAVLRTARRSRSRNFGVACIFLGGGSGLYHASLLPEWRLWDILGVYAVLFSLIAIGLAANFGRTGNDSVAIIAGWVAAFYAGIRRNEVRIGGIKLFDSTYVVVAGAAAVGVLALCSLVRMRDRRRGWGAVGMLVFAALFAIFGGLTDRFGGIWARPQAPVQGHAVWHIFGAIALLAAYEIFARSGYDEAIGMSSRSGRPERNAALQCNGGAPRVAIKCRAR